MKSPTRAANLHRFAAIDRAARTGQATKALQAGIDAAPNISITGGGTGRYNVGTGWDTTLSLNSLPPVVRQRVLQSILRKMGAGYDATLSGIAGFGKGIADGTTAGINAVGRGARAFGRGISDGTMAGLNAVGRGARTFGRGISNGTMAGLNTIGSGAREFGRGVRAGVDAYGQGIRELGGAIAQGSADIGRDVAGGAARMGRAMRNGTLAGLRGVRNFYRNHRQAFRDAGLIGGSTAAGYGVS